MLQTSEPTASTLSRDLTAGLVVFFVALPLCLGVAMASNAPLFSGVLAGIIGGALVGMLSGSQTSVSGPSAGSTAVVVAQIASLGSFRALLLALGPPRPRPIATGGPPGDDSFFRPARAERLFPAITTSTH